MPTYTIEVRKTYTATARYEIEAPDLDAATAIAKGPGAPAHQIGAWSVDRDERAQTFVRDIAHWVEVE